MVYFPRHRLLLPLMAAAMALALALVLVSGSKREQPHVQAPQSKILRQDHPAQAPASLANFQPAPQHPTRADRVAEGSILLSEGSQDLPDGVRVRECIFRTDFKYPLISVRETFDPSGGSPRTSIAVATHLIVGLPQSGSTDFLESLAAEGYTVHRRSASSPFVLVGWDADAAGPGVLDAQQERLMDLLPEAAYVEPDFIASAAGLPNDARVGEQWALAPSVGTFGISASEGWDVRNDASGIIVAVIDSGADLDHPDLLPNLWANDDYPNGSDDDDNGYKGDYRGYDFVQDDGLPEDMHGHGTAVAGIIGARGNNNRGMSGVCWRVQLMILRVLDHKAEGSYKDISDAIYYAADNGANVINLSLGGDDDSHTLANACAYAISKGVVLVAASGNAGRNIDYVPYYPASYLSVIAVGGHRRTGYPNPEPYGNYGRNTVPITAPAAGVLTTTLGGNYSPQTGTSFAAPHVSGAVALLLAQFPNENVPTTTERLLANVRFNQVSSANLDDYNLRMLDLDRALRDVNRGVAPGLEYTSPYFLQGAPAARISGGTPPFSVEWFHDDTPLEVTDSLELPEASPGEYRLRLTGRDGWTELDWLVWGWAAAPQDVAAELRTAGMSDVFQTVPASWTLEDDTLVSASVPVGTHSSISATFEGYAATGPAYLIYDWKLSAGEGDQGILYVDGEEFARVSSSEGWRTVIVPVLPGNSMEWRFSNNSDAGSASDFLEVWNPRFSLVPGTPQEIPVLSVHPGASVNLGIPIEDTSFANWYFNGNLVPDWNGDFALDIRNATEADQGLYTFEVTTPDGTETGHTFLNVINELTWRIEPQSVEVQEGASVTLRGLLDESTARYTWQKPGVADQSGTFLHIHSATLDDAGSYTLQAETADGRTLSTTVTLSVVPAAPRILSQPWVNHQDRLTLHVAGKAPRSYRFLKNGALLYEGADNFLPVTFGTGKDFYEVEVSNDHGWARSETFTLHGHVGAGPVIRAQVQDMWLSQDPSISNMLVADVPPGSIVYWSRNGSPLGFYAATLEVSEPGVYHYDVVAPDGRHERSRVATVLPALRTHRLLSARPPSTLYLAAGHTFQSPVSLFPGSASTPAAEFLWIKDGQAWSDVSSDLPPPFILDPVAPTDEGIYQLIQRSGSSWFVSQPVSVQVDAQGSAYEPDCSEAEARQVLLAAAGLQVHFHGGKHAYTPYLAFNIPADALKLAPGTFYYKGWLLRPEMRSAPGGAWLPAPVEDLQLPTRPFTTRSTPESWQSLYACRVDFDLGSGIPLLFRLRVEPLPNW